MYYYKLVGADHRLLWENKDALDKYLARLKELMQNDNSVNFYPAIYKIKKVVPLMRANNKK